MYLGYVTTRYNYKLVRSASDMHGCDGWVMGRTSKQATNYILVAGLEKSVGSEDPSDALKKANARFLLMKGVTRLIRIRHLV